MPTGSLFDLVLVGVYFLIVVFIGWWTGRKEDLEGFTIADREVGALQSGISAFAVLGGAVLVAQATLAFTMGVAAMWFWAGLTIGVVFLGFSSARLKPIADENDFLTIGEYFDFKWDRKSGILAAVVLFVAFFALLTMQFIAVGNILSPLFGWGYSMVVVMSGIVVLLYLLLGGYKTVVVTDVIQALVMLGVVGLIAVIAPFSGLSLDFSALFSPGWFSILTFIFIGILTMFASNDVWQRIYSASSSDTARRGMYITAVGFLIFGFVLTLVGIAAKGAFPGGSPNEAFFLGMFELIPKELLGLSLVAVLAAVMSTIDTEVYLVSSMVAKDFLQVDGSDRGIKSVLRWSMVVLAVLSMVVAIFFKDILTVLFGVVSLITMLSPAVIASLFWDLKDNAVFSSIVGGLLVMGYLVVTGQFTPTTAYASSIGAIVLLGLGQLLFKK